MSEQKHYLCYFDGCCEPYNPKGNMGMGACILDKVTGEVLHEHHSFIPKHPHNSNNVAEYLAFYNCLLYFKENNITNATIWVWGDSMLVTRQMLGLWRIKNGMYVDAAIMAKNVLKEVVSLNNHVSIKWIPREENQIADDLSKKHITEVKDWKRNKIIKLEK